MSKEDEFQRIVQNFQEDVLKIQEEKTKECFMTNIDSPDRFVACFGKIVDKLEDDQKKIAPLMMYAMAKTQHCIQTGTSQAQCWDNNIKFLKDRFAAYLKNF